ncbi:MAG: hypothetical protein M0Q53_08010 [Prolixibacteraceae bacterium]|jgi:hypothetical protein|nr:hypothetical protein [Prolixibacteraceae bacterium]
MKEFQQKLFNSLLAITILVGCTKKDGLHDLSYSLNPVDSILNIHSSQLRDTSNYQNPLSTDTISYGKLKIFFFTTRVEEVLTQKNPWEKILINYFTVIKTDSLWKMWYESYDQFGDFKSYVCYAYSYDGKNWIEPLSENENYPLPNNIIYSGVRGLGNHAPSVFLDMNDHTYPFKMIFLRRNPLISPQERLFLAKSKDGINWNNAHLFIDRFADTQNVCIPFQNNYLFYLRGWYNDNIRSIYTLETDTSGRIIKPYTLLYKADESFSTYTNTYNSAASQLNDSTILFFPTMFDPFSNKVKIALMVSFNFQNIKLIMNDITLNVVGGISSPLSICISPGLIRSEKKDIYWLYFTTRNKDHSYNDVDIISTYYRIPVLVKTI